MNKIDLSFILSYKCNLECSFCMYNCSKKEKDFIDFDILIKFIKTIDFNIVNLIGYFGGEVSIMINEYEYLSSLLPKNFPKFCITNGAWSLNENHTKNFLKFISNDNFKYVKISCTKEHKKFQNENVIKKVIKENCLFYIKTDDLKRKLNPMGKLNYKKNDCTKICKKNETKRYTILPNGDIIFQLCDGKNPIIGNIKNIVFKDLFKIDLKCPYI